MIEVNYIRGRGDSTGLKVFKMVLKIVIPMIFLATGLILLFLVIPGWSLILGIPSIVFGIVFLLYSYDDMSSQSDIHDND
jgi:hypothetical protein